MGGIKPGPSGDCDDHIQKGPDMGEDPPVQQHMQQDQQKGYATTSCKAFCRQSVGNEVWPLRACASLFV